MLRHATVTLLLLLTGCSGPGPRGLDSPDATERARSGIAAAHTRDMSAIPRLIGLLESDDPACRMAAVGALKELTGKTLAYDYAASPPERAHAVERWKSWLGSPEGLKLRSEGSKP